MLRVSRFLLLGLALLATTPALAQRGACNGAIQAAEAEFGVPRGLLMAIARVESGRADRATGRVDPWPWSINAEGRGSSYPSLAEAAAAVRRLQETGVRSIDTGCMQINMRHHPQAFASLEEAFDPVANARYAARFLLALQQRAGDWMTAAGHYHSQTPERAEGYRARVQAAWNAERANPTPGSAMAESRPAAPSAATAPATREEAARDAEAPMLAAYRAAPIPIAGRAAVRAPAAAPTPEPAPAPAPTRLAASELWNPTGRRPLF
jgi:hypothetical protein